MEKESTLVKVCMVCKRQMYLDGSLSLEPYKLQRGVAVSHGLCAVCAPLWEQQTRIDLEQDRLSRR